VYATASEQRQKLVACLMAKNQLWAGQTLLVMFVLATNVIPPPKTS
jgi:hypothetical protein